VAVGIAFTGIVLFIEKPVRGARTLFFQKKDFQM
jgi:hypothetical protein